MADCTNAVPIADVPRYLEAALRQLFEGSLITIAAEMLDDPATVARLEEIGVYQRLTSLLAWVLHLRQEPLTDLDARVAEDIGRMRLEDLPAPFNELCKPFLRSEPVRG